MSIAEEWDERYRQFDRMWSGNPNSALLHAVASLGLRPGFAVDVGCGEGADALWLSDAGWHVTAFDPSSVAITRARAADAKGAVTWLVGRLEDVDVEGTFGLVTVMYPVLDATDDTVSRLWSLVAPGGVLLFVHHEGCSDILTPDDVAKMSPGRVILNETHEKDVTHGSGAQHHTYHIIAVWAE